MAISAATLTVDVDANTSKAEKGLSSIGSMIADIGSKPFKAIGSIVDFGSKVGIAAIGVKGLAQAASGLAGGLFNMNATLETSTLQFATLMGSTDLAQKHVQDLFKFAADTPFETGPIIQASRTMETFGGAALDTMDNLTLFGDAAAGTSNDISEVAFWSSRAYAAIQGGQPFGEAAMRLQEMGIITPQVATHLQELQKNGASASEQWDVLSQAMGRFTGGMKAQATTWSGLTSTFSDSIHLLLSSAMQPLFEQAERGLTRLNELLSSPAFTEWATTFGNALASGIGVGVAALSKLARLLNGPVTAAFVLVRDSITTFKEAVRGDWTNSDAIRPFHRIIGEVGLLLHDTVIPGVKGALDAFQRLAPYVKTVAQYGGDLLAVLNPMGTILKDVALGFGENGLAGILPGVKQGLDDVLGSARDLGSGLLTAFGNIDWGAVWGDVSAAGSGLLSSITTAVGGIDWSSVASTIASGIGTAWGALTDVGGHIWNWVSNGVGNIQWGDIAKVIATGVGTAWGALTTAGAAVYNWVVGGLASVNWTALATEIAKDIGAAWSLLTDGATYVYNWISAGLSGLDWNALATTIKGYIATAIGAGAELVNAVKAALTGPDPTAYYQTGYGIGFTAGQGVGAGLKDGQPKDDGFWATYKRNASENLSGVTSALGELAASVGRFAGSTGQLLGALQPEFKAAAITAGLFALAGSKIVGFLVDLGVAVGKIDLKILSSAFNIAAGQVSALADDINFFNTKILPVLGTAARGAALAVVGAFNTLSQDVGSAIDTLSGIVSGIPDTFSTVETNIVAVFTSAPTWLAQAGLDIITGLVNGITGALTSLDPTGKVAVVATDIPAIFTSAISWLITAGSDIIQGLADGITGAIATLDPVGKVSVLQTGITSALSGAISWLYNNGYDAIQGLVNGIEAAIAALNPVGIIKGIASDAIDALGRFGHSPWPAMEEHGADAVQGFTNGVADNASGPVDAIVTLGKMFLDAARQAFGDAGSDAAKSVADAMSAIFNAVKAGTDALAGLLGFSAPSAAAVIAFRDSTIFLVQTMRDAAGAIDDDGLKAASDYAKAAGSVLGIVASGADALTKLNDFERPTDEAIADFKFSTEKLVTSLADSGGIMSTEALSATTLYSTSAGQALAILSDGIDGLSKLNDFIAPADDAVSAFKFSTEKLVTSLADSGGIMTQDGEAAASNFSAAAQVALGLLKDGLEGFALLLDFIRPTDESISSFKFAVEKLVRSIEDSGGVFGTDGLAAATAFADAAGPILDLLKSGLEGFADLTHADQSSQLDAAIALFGDRVQLLVEAMATAAASFREHGLPEAKAFADAAGPIIDLVESGLTAFAALTQPGQIMPDDGSILFFTDRVEMLVEGIATAASYFRIGGTQAAQDFAGAAGPIIDLVASGLDAFKALTTPGQIMPGDDTIAFFGDRVEMLVEAVATAASYFRAGGLAAATDFADSAGPIVSLVSDAVASFAALADAPEMSDQTDITNALIAWVKVVVAGVVAAAKGMDTKGLKAAQDFADAGGAALSLITSGVQALADLGKAELKDDLDAGLDALLAFVQEAVVKLEAAAATFDTDGLDAAKAYADAASAVLDVIGKASNFDALKDYSGQMNDGIDAFFADIKLAVQKLIALGAELGDGLTEAQKIAQQINDIVDLLTPAASPASGGGGSSGGGGGGSIGGHAGGGTSGTGAFFNTGSGPYPVAAPVVDKSGSAPAPIVNVQVNATLDGAAITQNVETRVLSFARAM